MARGKRITFRGGGWTSLPATSGSLSDSEDSNASVSCADRRRARLAASLARLRDSCDKGGRRCTGAIRRAGLDGSGTGGSHESDASSALTLLGDAGGFEGRMDLTRSSGKCVNYGKIGEVSTT